MEALQDLARMLELGQQVFRISTNPAEPGAIDKLRALDAELKAIRAKYPDAPTMPAINPRPAERH